MRIRHIEVFHAVYTCGSVTQAANFLNVSQPSVSKVLSHAELQLGFALFERNSGKLVPTPEANRLYEHVATLFDQLSVVRRVASNIKNLGEGKIRLASTPAMAIDVVPEIVSSFMSEHPGVYFELETLHYSEIVTALEESRIELGLVFDPPKQQGVVEIPVAKGEFVFIKPEELSLDIDLPVDLSQLGGLPFIRLNNRGPLGQLLDAHLQESEVTLNVIAATETYDIAHALVAKGLGVSIVDQITARSHRDAKIEILPLRFPLSFQISAVQTQQTPLSMIASSFVEHTKRSIRSMLGSQ